MPKPKRRSKKGSVQIVNRNGLLTLRLSYEGARHQRALGLPDTPINRELARRKACEVELDIASGNFDPTFDQYFPREAAPDRPSHHLGTLGTVHRASQKRPYQRTSGR